jgi:hypothetical protein
VVDEDGFMSSTAKPRLKRYAAALLVSCCWLAVVLMTLWAAAALAIDVHAHWLGYSAAVLYVVLILFAAWNVRGRFRRMAVCIAGFLIVLVWWLSLKPSNDRPWQADVNQTPWVEINGDQVTIHNFRNCDYRTEFDYTCQWLTKTVSLSQLRGVDLAITYWGSAYIAHPIVSFQFGDDNYVATSVETRKEIGEGYSAVLGFFRQYELIYILADERDVIRLRTNYRTGEDVYLFHTTAGPEWSRKLFLEYVARANRLHQHPEWYNALTSNCTTNIFDQMALTGRLPVGSTLHDWRILLNGRADEMLYNGGNFAGGLPFPELKQNAHINAAARAADHDTNFSRKIRVGRPGFEFLQAADAARREATCCGP